MVTYIQLSFFGDFEKFSTANTDKYLELIKFFSTKNYEPATTSQLKLNSNGVAQTAIMPIFLNEGECLIEILNERINIKVINNVKDISGAVLVQKFKDKIYEDLKNFLEKFNVFSNRLALVCETMDELVETNNNVLNEQNIVEKSGRVLKREILSGEKCNIIVENNENYENKVIRKFYDFNTIFENSTFRFSVQNCISIFDSFFDILEQHIGVDSK